MYYGENVKLTPLEKKDIEPIYELFNDVELRSYLSNSIYVTHDDEVNWVESSTEAKKKGDYRLAVRTIDETFLGTSGIALHHVIHRSATVGISIMKKQYWGKGYGTDAMRTLIAFGFLILNLNRIDLEVHVFNKRAIKSYKKVGFKEVGMKRQAHFIKGQYVNSVMMDILKSEFDSLYSDIDLSEPTSWQVNT